VLELGKVSMMIRQDEDRRSPRSCDLRVNASNITDHTLSALHTLAPSRISIAESCIEIARYDAVRSMQGKVKNHRRCMNVTD
jgi:hypothetical protein